MIDKLKDSFVFYGSWWEILDDEDEATKFEVINAIMSYVFKNEIKELDRTSSKMAFKFIKRDIDRAIANHNQFIEKQSLNGKMGGRPKTNKNPKKPSLFWDNSGNPNKPNETQQNPTKPNETQKSHNVNVNDNVNVNVNDNVNDNLLEQKKIKSKIILSDNQNNFIAKYPNWKKDFNQYIDSLNEYREQIRADPKFLTELTTTYSGYDISLSLQKFFDGFWASEEGWKNKVSKNTSTINWHSTFKNNFDRCLIKLK